jgi:hypothetical protein
MEEGNESSSGMRPRAGSCLGPVVGGGRITGRRAKAAAWARLDQESSIDCTALAE